MANFFVQMGRAEHLGTGVRNLYHYAPIYLGAEPTITDDDMFRIRLNIAESKRAELAISATESTTDRTTESSEKSSEKKFGEKDIVEKLGKKLGKNRIRIIELIVSNPNITYSELAEALSVSSTTIENRIAEMSDVIIKRVGPKNGGHWEVIEN